MKLCYTFSIIPHSVKGQPNHGLLYCTYSRPWSDDDNNDNIKTPYQQPQQQQPRQEMTIMTDPRNRRAVLIIQKKHYRHGKEISQIDDGYMNIFNGGAI